jgi:hypothetical protein
MKAPPPEVIRAAQRFARVGRRIGMVRACALGMVLLQIGWIFAVPPFRGSDEFDHTYRAAAVARGQWVADPTSATRGTGAFVLVPRDIVEAASDECRRLPYTQAADCVPRGSGSMVEVASGAGRYNPAFYFLIGAPALPFEGVSAHYVMRASAALLCWLMFLGAVCAARHNARTSWPLVGLAVATTPVVVFSTSIVAPNGLELMSALAYWLSLIAVLTPDPGDAPPWLIAVLTLSGILLLTVRSLGPLWFGMATLAVLVLTKTSLRRICRVLVSSRQMVTASAALAVAAVAGVVWTRGQGALRIGVEAGSSHSDWEVVQRIVSHLPVWIFQSVAAFPTRDTAGPPVIYLADFFLLALLLTLAIRRSRTRVRWVVAGVGILSLAVPAVVTFRTYDLFGLAWQGRYTMPFAMGLAVVSAMGLDAVRARLRADLVFLGVAATAVAQTLGAVALMMRERQGSPGVASGAWMLLPTWAIAVVMTVGAVLLWLGTMAEIPGVSTPEADDTGASQGAER